MKNPKIKLSLMGSMILSAVAITNPASAHDIAGTLTAGALTKGSGVTDVWTVTCFQDPTAASQSPTDHLFLSVRDDSAAGGQVSATALWNDTVVNQVPNNLATAVTVTDLTPGDGIPTASKILKLPTARQDATFTLLVHHTSAATDNYLVSVHCQDLQNRHTGTEEPSSLQNQ